MIKRILELKAWHIFIPFLLILVAVPLAPQIEETDTYITMHQDSYYNIVFTLIGTLCWGTIIVWMYVIGLTFIKRIPKDIPSNITLFKILFLLFVISFLWIYMSVSTMDITNMNSIGSYFITAFGFLFFLCFFIIAKQVAKAISIWEYNGNVRFWHYLLNIFFIIYFPLGIWFLQPKVNRMINGEIGTRRIKLSEDNGVVYNCSNCGAKVYFGQTKCQRCGELFENV
jgi:hypothetical protein